MTLSLKRPYILIQDSYPKNSGILKHDRYKLYLNCQMFLAEIIESNYMFKITIYQ